MYTPDVNVIDDIDVLHRHIRTYPFGVCSSIVNDDIVVDHLPFMIDETRGDFGTLMTHVSRKNNIWRNVDRNKRVVVVFQGEQSYISPTWYDDPSHAVPTWNYAVVHARGLPTVIEDSEWLLRHVSALTDIHETGGSPAWRVADASDVFVERLLNAIVGIEIPISSLEGKWKLGQNKSQSDRMAMLDALSFSEKAGAPGMAKLMAEYVN